jgi:nitrite reductase/ring-hydroxylating ferredoxin subunit
VFDVRSGAALSGPASVGLKRFGVAVEGGKVLVDVGA